MACAVYCSRVKCAKRDQEENTKAASLLLVVASRSCSVSLRALNTSLSTVAHESIVDAVDTSSFGRAEGGLGSGLLLFESKDKLPLCLADTLHAQA